MFAAAKTYEQTYQINMKILFKNHIKIQAVLRYQKTTILTPKNQQNLINIDETSVKNVLFVTKSVKWFPKWPKFATRWVLWTSFWPTWSNLGPTWGPLGPIWGQFGAKVEPRNLKISSKFNNNHENHMVFTLWNGFGLF